MNRTGRGDWRAVEDAVARVLEKRLFVVGGVMKSGTTWVQHLLDAHPAVACRGEGHLMGALSDGLGAAYRGYGDYLRDKTRRELGELRAPFPPPDDDEAAYVLRHALLARLARIDGPAVRALGEKTTTNVAAAETLLGLLPGLRAVHVVRDPRDVVVSAWFHDLRVAEGATRRAFEDIAAFVPYMAGQWREQVEAARAFAGRHPENFHEVRYEDLVEDPEAVVPGLYDFLGVGPAPAAACIEAARFENLSGGRPRGDEDPGSFFRKGVIGDWANHLDGPMEATVRASCGPVMAELGY